MDALAGAQKLISNADSTLLTKWQQRKRSLHNLYGEAETENTMLSLSRLCDPESISVYGRALIQNAHNLMRKGKLTDALEEINQFKTLDQPSELEKVTLAKVSLERGRILQCLGEWPEALSSFQWTRGNMHLPLPNMCRLTCYMTETWCELGDPKKAMEFALEQSNDMSRAGWSKLNRAHGLQLSLGEAYLQLNMLEAAQTTFEELLSLLQEKQDLNSIKKVRLLRLRIGLARIFQIRGDVRRALTEWAEAQSALNKCGWGTGFTHAVILLSQSDIYQQLEDHNYAADLRSQGQDILKGVAEGKWMPCIGTKWVQWILSRFPAGSKTEATLTVP